MSGLQPLNDFTTPWKERPHIDTYWLEIAKILIHPFLQQYRKCNKSTIKNISYKIINDADAVDLYLERFLKDGDDLGNFRMNLKGPNKKIYNILRSLNSAAKVCKCLESTQHLDHEGVYKGWAREDAPFWSTRVPLLKDYVLRRILEKLKFPIPIRLVRPSATTTTTRSPLVTSNLPLATTSNATLAPIEEAVTAPIAMSAHEVFNPDADSGEREVTMPAHSDDDDHCYAPRTLSPDDENETFPSTPPLDRHYTPPPSALSFSNSSDIVPEFFFEEEEEDEIQHVDCNRVNFMTQHPEAVPVDNVEFLDDDQQQQQLIEDLRQQNNVEQQQQNNNLLSALSTLTINTQQVLNMRGIRENERRNLMSLEQACASVAQRLEGHEDMPNQRFIMVKLNSIALTESIGPVDGYLGFFAKCTSVLVVTIEGLSQANHENPQLAVVLPAYGNPQERKKHIDGVLKNLASNAKERRIKIIACVADDHYENRVVKKRLRALCHILGQACFHAAPIDGHVFIYQGVTVEVKMLQLLSSTFYGVGHEVTIMLEAFWAFAAKRTANTNFGVFAGMKAEFFKVLLAKVRTQGPTRDPNRMFPHFLPFMRYIGTLKDILEDIKFEEDMTEEKCAIYLQYIIFLKRFQFPKSDFHEELIRTLSHMTAFYQVEGISFKISLFTIKLLYEMYDIAKEIPRQLTTLNQFTTQLPMHRRFSFDTSSFFSLTREVDFDPLDDELRFNNNGDELINFNVPSYALPLVGQNHVDRAAIRYRHMRIERFEDPDEENRFIQIVAQCLAIEDAMDRGGYNVVHFEGVEPLLVRVALLAIP